MPCYDVPRAYSVDRIQLWIAGRPYNWSGGFGAVLQSVERGIQAGDTRVIAGVLFHVAYVHPRSWGHAPTVCWTIPNDVITAEWIRAFKAVLCGCAAPDRDEAAQ